MKDFINHLAYMISESGDSPSYDDIYTICKKLGKEPDEQTMTKEEYDSLGDEEKEEIHKAATSTASFDDLDPEMDSEQYWRKFNDWNRKGEQQRARFDDEGLPVDPKERADFFAKRRGKKKKSGVINAFLFVCEICMEYGDFQENPDGEGEDIQPEKTTYKKIGTLMYEEVDEALAEMEKRKAEMVKKFGIDENAFTDNEEIIPIGIRREDPNAFIQFYDKFEGEGEKFAKKRGPQAKNASPEDKEPHSVGFQKRTRRVVAEYIIYQSESFISKEQSNKIAKMFDKDA